MKERRIGRKGRREGWRERERERKREERKKEKERKKEREVKEEEERQGGGGENIRKMWHAKWKVCTTMRVPSISDSVTEHVSKVRLKGIQRY